MKLTRFLTPEFFREMSKMLLGRGRALTLSPDSSGFPDSGDSGREPMAKMADSGEENLKLDAPSGLSSGELAAKSGSFDQEPELTGDTFSDSEL